MKKVYLIIVTLLLFVNYLFSSVNLFKIYESEYFIYYVQDKYNYSGLSVELEKYYKSFSKKMNYTNKEKTAVRIFKDINIFHQYLNLNNLQDRQIIYNKDGINLVSPFNAGPVYNYKSALSIMGRASILSILDDINNSLPNWIKDGVCGYEVNYDKGKTINFIKNYLKSNEFPSLQDINNEQKLSGFCSSFIEYILNKGDYNKLKELIINPDDCKNIYGYDKFELYNEWKNSILKNL